MRSTPLFPDLGFGIGLRSEHYNDAVERLGAVEWFEAISENYMETGGRPLTVLEQVRRDHPLALHGVALSIGSTDPIDLSYLAKLRTLIERVEPALVTDHLCWTGVGQRPLFDLLPLPYTEEALRHVVDRIVRVQDFLGRRIALENPSTYVAFQCSTMAESEFLAAVAEKADCGILLDVNNVYVSAHNLGFAAEPYFDSLPSERIAQIHLGGFTDMGDYLFDTHSAPVHADVWRLYRAAVERFASVSTLVEWDADIPSFDRVVEEVETARNVASEALGRLESRLDPPFEKQGRPRHPTAEAA
jgi:uncharacterized protein (UPF0276 family)